MVTVSEDLLKEGTDVLATGNAEEIHKLGDRIVSVEPENWYGLYIRGCAYALEADFANCISNWDKFINNLEDDSFLEKSCDYMASIMVKCLTSLSGKPPLDFGKFGQMLLVINDKLPESDDEVLVTAIMDGAIEYLKDNACTEPYLTYNAFKALTFCSFRAYVEFPLIGGFFEKLMTIGDEIKARSEPAVGGIIDTDRMFLTEVKNAIDTAVAGCSEEDLEKIEEYWLGHKTDSYVGHIQQAYNMSAAYVQAGKLTGKILKKSMLLEVQTFATVYLRGKM